MRSFYPKLNILVLSLGQLNLQICICGSWARTRDWAELPLVTVEKERSCQKGTVSVEEDFEFPGSVMVPFTKTEWRKKRRFVLGAGVGWVTCSFGTWWTRVPVRNSKDETQEAFLCTHVTLGIWRRKPLASLLLMEESGECKRQMQRELEGRNAEWISPPRVT